MEFTVSHELDDLLGYDDVCQDCDSTMEYCGMDVYDEWGPNCQKLADYLNDEYGINRGHCEWIGQMEPLAEFLLTAIENSDRIVS